MSLRHFSLAICLVWACDPDAAPRAPLDYEPPPQAPSPVGDIGDDGPILKPLDAGVKREAGTALEVGAGLDAGTGREAGAGLDASAGREAGVGLDAGAGREAGPGAEAGAGLEAGTGAEAGADATLGPSSPSTQLITSEVALHGGILAHCAQLSPDDVYMVAGIQGLAASAVYSFDSLQAPCGNVGSEYATISSSGQVLFVEDDLMELGVDLPRFQGSASWASTNSAPDKILQDLQIETWQSCSYFQIFDFPDSDEFIVKCEEYTLHDPSGVTLAANNGYLFAVGKGGLMLTLRAAEGTELYPKLALFKDHAIQTQVTYPDMLTDPIAARSSGDGFLVALGSAARSPSDESEYDHLYFFAANGQLEDRGRYVALGQIAGEYATGGSALVVGRSAALSAAGVLYQSWTKVFPGERIPRGIVVRRRPGATEPEIVYEDPAVQDAKGYLMPHALKRLITGS